jgi:predicted ArsR family transcriptional regulator
MTPASAAAIGRTLSRLGRSAGSAQRPPHSSREAVYHVILGSRGAIPIDVICRETGLHANTVRPHLEVLLATGSIRRDAGPAEGRGRPPWHYSAVETPAQQERRSLGEALLEQLAEADSGQIAGAAAARWAGHLDAEHRHSPAHNIDEAVGNAADSLAGLGFEVSVTPAGDRIDLKGCPYADLVAERPVICDIHASLLQQFLDSSGQPVALERLDVWNAPGVCTAHLRRSDHEPYRTITMGSTE